MEKERLEWVMSGLSHYHLTAREDQFIKSVNQDFSQKNMLTEEQEEKLESLYKEKSNLIPNRNYFSPKESSPPTKTKAKRFRPKWIT
jgi:DNA repair ATPase RecN